jgi:ketosteroid isomerase-like protein
MRIRPAALPPIVLAGALMAPGACGAGGSSSDTSKFNGAAKDVAQAVYDLRDAIAKRDENKICDDFVTDALRTQLAGLAKQGPHPRGTTCADELKDSIQDIDATDIKVQSVTVTGNTATATYRTNLSHGTDPVDTLHFANQRGWRLTQLP